MAITEAMKVSGCFQAWCVHGKIPNILRVRVSFENFEVSEQRLHETEYQALGALMLTFSFMHIMFFFKKQKRYIKNVFI